MANTVYDKKVIETVAKEQLITKVNTRALMDVDTSLAEASGMTKTINVYSFTGGAEALEAGQGNTHRGKLSFAPVDYKVKRVQENFEYTDEDFHADNSIVDIGVKGATDSLKNKMIADFVAECGKATLSVPGTLGYASIVDAIAKLNIEDETEIFVVIPNEEKAALRKDEDYKDARIGEVVYTGQVGQVCGVPVVAMNGIDAPYVMTKAAIKLLLKKDIEAGTDRNEDTCVNTVYVRAFYICALHDATKICKIGE